MHQSACCSTITAFLQGPATAGVLRVLNHQISDRSRGGAEVGGECRDRGRGLVLGNKIRTEARDQRSGAGQPARFQFAEVSRPAWGRLPPAEVSRMQS